MKVNKIIRQIETEIDVHKIRYKNLSLWLEIRNRLFYKLSLGVETNLKINSTTIFNVINNIFYGFINWFKNYDTWFFSASINRVLIEGKYYDRLFDYPASRLDKSLFIELSIQKFEKRKLMASRNIVSRSPLIILEKMFGLFISTKKIDTALLQHIDEKYQIKLNSNYAIKKMIAQYWVMKWLLRVKKTPKVVFIAPSYTSYGYIKALKEKKVMVVEIQHGVINKEHFGYNLYSEFDRQYFPDYLLTFGDREKAIFEGMNKSIEPNNVWTVGSFYIDHIKNNYVKKNLAKAGITFSVSLQDCVIGQKLIPFIITLAKNNPKFYFLLKPRRTPIEEYNSLYDFPDNIHLVEDMNVYEIILESDYHITAFSSCALEAPALGVKNILINIDNKAKDYYGEILTSATTTYVSSTSEFLAAIENTVPDSNAITTAHANIMSDNYKANIDEFLKTIYG